MSTRFHLQRRNITVERAQPVTEIVATHLNVNNFCIELVRLNGGYFKSKLVQVSSSPALELEFQGQCQDAPICFIINELISNNKTGLLSLANTKEIEYPNSNVEFQQCHQKKWCHSRLNRLQWPPLTPKLASELQRCWWRMLETICVIDKFKMLVTDFYIENVIKRRLWFPHQYLTVNIVGSSWELCLSRIFWLWMRLDLGRVWQYKFKQIVKSLGLSTK